jgi:excisionase family DNA binding protein
MKQIILLLEEVKEILLLQTKHVITVKEFCVLTGFSQAYAYRIIAKRALPFYKPLGGTIFFKKEDVFDFMSSNKVQGKEVTQQQVSNYLLNSIK